MSRTNSQSYLPRGGPNRSSVSQCHRVRHACGSFAQSREIQQKPRPAPRGAEPGLEKAGLALLLPDGGPEDLDGPVEPQHLHEDVRAALVLRDDEAVRVADPRDALLA